MTPTAGKLLDRMSVEREAYDQGHLKELLGSSAERRSSASEVPVGMASERPSLSGEEWGMSAPVTTQD